ncbi:MAG: hypothetical protein ACUVT2_12575, partial [Thiobacillaceae bacterium]
PEPTAAPPTETAPPVPTATPTAGVTPTDTPIPPPSLTPKPTVPAAQGVLFNFEEWRDWRRGDQPHGEFRPTQDQVHTGGQAAKLTYQFPDTEQDFVVFLQPVNLSGQPDSFSAWVFGDGSGHYLNFWVQDAQNEVWSVPLGKVGDGAWKQMVGKLDPSLGWPAGHISGPDNGVVDYPVRFYALVLDRPQSGPQTGAIYVDDISVWKGGGGATATPGPTATPAPAPTDTDTPAPSAGPLSFPEPTRLDAWRDVGGGNYECTIIVHISGGGPPFKVYHDSVVSTSGTDQRDYPLVFTAAGCSIVHTITVESADGQRYADDYYIPSPWCS